MTRMTRRSRGTMVVIVMAGVIFAAGVYGFGSKFEELIRTVMTSESQGGGSFALIPIINYMLATAGFVCLFIWGVRNGMLRDVEKPKHELLERERELDRAEGIIWEERL